MHEVKTFLISICLVKLGIGAFKNGKDKLHVQVEIRKLYERLCL